MTLFLCRRLGPSDCYITKGAHCLRSTDNSGFNMLSMEACAVIWTPLSSSKCTEVHVYAFLGMECLSLSWVCNTTFFSPYPLYVIANSYVVVHTFILKYWLTSSALSATSLSGSSQLSFTSCLITFKGNRIFSSMILVTNHSGNIRWWWSPPI